MREGNKTEAIKSISSAENNTIKTSLFIGHFLESKYTNNGKITDMKNKNFN